MNVLDLFSGIGGFSLGLERAGGFETVAFCEIEPFCRAVLAKHWPAVPCYGDIRELSADQLTADGIAVDCICGGFPCQDISAAGKGAGITGERSGLWTHYARLIRELRPQYVVIENVSAFCWVEDLTPYSETWPRSGMTRSGTAYRLPTWAPLTVETESGSWPAPHGFSQDGRSNGPSGNELGNAVNRSLWPTPNLPSGGRTLHHVDEWRGNQAYHKGKKVQVDLAQAVRLWATPRAADGDKGIRTPEGAARERLRRKNGEDLPTQAGGSLNPTWVEWLMGFPLAWTRLLAYPSNPFRKSKAKLPPVASTGSAPSATQSSRKSSKSSAAQS